jgi:hypothetical protein
MLYFYPIDCDDISISELLKYMIRKSIIFLVLITIGMQSACIAEDQHLGQRQALNIAWKTLDPNTISHDIESWETDEAIKVRGGEVVSEFSVPSRDNCPGPRLPDNLPIKVSSEYWYIKVQPHPQVQRTQKDTAAPESLTVIPEPNIISAIFLIDIYNGEVVARKLICQDAP